ncbi:hypothetical protein M413DRAFT_256408 [Hebeloma cylindrosporum]|uniref:Uncharacterized protein n=1 Tax=Hebeloma cylindrosporum TaxID=76867 RepID=A0A0C3BM70_HEBCY|nr:hypothetical protein M413DRAFT_256408 [Hebeloma cylindrosporum h7]
MGNAMDDTKSANALEKPKAPKQPRPPLTLEDIGEAPPLMNTGHPRTGKRVRLRVLAFPFPPEAQDEWADRRKFALHLNQDSRQFETHLGSPKTNAQDVSTGPRALQRQAQYRMHRYRRHVECDSCGVGARGGSGAHTGSAEGFGNQEAPVLGQAGPSMSHSAPPPPSRYGAPRVVYLHANSSDFSTVKDRSGIWYMSCWRS